MVTLQVFVLELTFDSRSLVFTCLDLTEVLSEAQLNLHLIQIKHKEMNYIRARINPSVSFPGQGTVLFGDKTGLTPSAFDRINVRRLFITLEKQYQLLLNFNCLNSMMNLQEQTLETL